MPRVPARARRAGRRHEEGLARDAAVEALRARPPAPKTGPLTPDGSRRATGDVDFLVEAHGADALHEALTRAGYEALHRSTDVANYRATAAILTGVDLLFARRPPTLAMLDRASVPEGQAGVPVVDAEGLIGLKLQAIVNDPRRRRQDEADIVTLLTLRLPSLNLALLEEYFELFDRREDLARFLAEARRHRSG